jgi:RNA polymerase sigma factor (sigma-70 family)
MTSPALDREFAQSTARATDASLVVRAAAGDEAAFTRIVAAFHSDLLRVSFVITGDPDLAEDAVQQAWQTAWRKLRSLREPDRVKSWLIAVAANEARQLIRRTRRRPGVVSLERTPDPGGQILCLGADPSLDPETLDLATALEHLDPEDRALLAIRYVLGFNSTEIARALGRRPGGIRSRLSRVLARLRRDLSDE